VRRLFCAVRYRVDDFQPTLFTRSATGINGCVRALGPGIDGPAWLMSGTAFLRGERIIFTLSMHGIIAMARHRK